MRFLTEAGDLRCNHMGGVVKHRSSQSLVKIDGSPILVKPDPKGRPISGCPNAGPTIKPCTATTSVQAGYSNWIEIDGQAACLDTVVGLTDGTPPGIVQFKVVDQGQDWVWGE